MSKSLGDLYDTKILINFIILFIIYIIINNFRKWKNLKMEII